MSLSPLPEFFSQKPKKKMALMVNKAYTKDIQKTKTRNERMSEIFSSLKTTNEMDGLFTQEDIDNRYYIMGQCDACTEWSKWDSRVGKWKCLNCGQDKYDMRGSRSIRSWLVTKDIKKTRAKRTRGQS